MVSSFRTALSRDLAAAMGEFFGTVTFLLLGLGGIQAAASAQSPSAQDTSTTSVQQLMYIATSMGLSLVVSAWIFFRVTGAVFNPQIALALLICGIITPVRFLLYVVAQLVGSIAASAILQALLPGKLSVTPGLGVGTSRTQGIFIEMFLTAALVLSVLMLAAEKHRTTAFAPIGIGLTLFAGQLWGVVYTGAAMNTARAFGPSVINGFTSYHWIYWLGPTLGSLLASAIYIFFKAVKYHELTPDQDTEDPSQSPEIGGAGGGVVASDRSNGNLRRAEKLNGETV